MKHVVFIVVFLSLFSLTGQTQNILYDTNAVSNIIKGGKDSIPSIISKIDLKIKGNVGFNNTMSSMFNPGINYNFIGINYVYILNLMLDTGFLNVPRNIGPDMRKYQNYNSYCVLVEGSGQFVTYNDLVKIKKGITDWWNKNQYLSLELLQKKWREDNVLRNMGYYFK